MSHTANQPLDTSDLDAAPAIVREASERSDTWRLYLVTTYKDGSTWHRTGFVGKTIGWKPGWLLMTSRRAIGSSDLLTASTWETTVVAGVQRGDGWGYYEPRTGKRVMPGRNRYAEAE